ncbi:MAG: hypothetical protein QXP96_05330 [Thermoproteota archaeon]
MSEKKVVKKKRIFVFLPIDLYEKAYEKLPKNDEGKPLWSWFFTDILKLYLRGDLLWIPNSEVIVKKVNLCIEEDGGKGVEQLEEPVIIDGVEFTLKPIGNAWEDESLLSGSPQTSRQSGSRDTHTPPSQEDTGETG